jgi:xanthine dehydrogenase accessory factor
MPRGLSDIRIIIRGAGDLATGTACRLHRSGFFKLLMTEVEHPLAVRRMVSFCEAIHEGSWTVEGIQSARASSLDEVEDSWMSGIIPVVVDPENAFRIKINPDVVVDAIMAKKNTGTRITDAALVIGLGPGFCAGEDVHYVIETNRGHDLGRLISKGPALPDTGVPGNIGGKTSQRVVRSPADGIFDSSLQIGSFVTKGTVVGNVSGSPVEVTVTGVLRGLIRPGTRVTTDLKIGDVDPRGEPSMCLTISEKAGAIAGAVLEAILMTFNNPVINRSHVLLGT